MFAIDNRIIDRLHALLCDDGATSTTEYAIMIALIVLVAIGAIASLGQSAGDNFTTIANVADSM